MSEALVIRLDDADATLASWVAVDATGALLGATGRGPLSDAVPVAASRQVVALVPASDVLRLKAEVPVKGGGSRLLQALPFALEEQIAEDVEAMHFAAGGRDDAGRVDVAAVRRERMAQWRERFDNAGLVPQRMYSEADAVQAMPNTATLMVGHGSAVLTEPEGAVSTVDADNVGGLLTLWLARRSAGEHADQPLHLVVYGDDATLAGLEPALEELRPRLASLDLRVLADGPLPRLAAQIVTAPGVNLLQGEFAQRTGLSTFWPAWRLAVLLAASGFVLAVATGWADVRRQRAELAALDGTIDRAFHYVFPDAGPITDPRAQLSAELQRFGEGSRGGSHEFLDALRTLSQALAGTSGVRLEALSYRSGTLELRLQAPSVEVLDKLQQQMTGAGLTAAIQSANPTEGGVTGRLQIKRSGS